MKGRKKPTTKTKLCSRASGKCNFGLMNKHVEFTDERVMDFFYIPRIECIEGILLTKL